MVMLLPGKNAYSEPPTEEDHAAIAGSWIVTAKGVERRYDITAGRNIKIVGGGYKEKRGRLTPQNDGSYHVKIDGNQILRLVYTRESDQLSVELFSEKNLELGLSPGWKTRGVRKQP